MRNTWKNLIFSLLVGLNVALNPLIVLATTTGSDQNTDQVRLNTDGEVMFLSTSINNNSVTPNRLTQQQPLNSAGHGFSNFVSQIQQPMGFTDDLGSYFNSVLTLVMVVSLLLVFLQFILAGFQWITSGGDKSKTEEARNKIVNAFVGILIVSSSFAVAGFVAWILGFESINQALAGISRINPS